MKLLLVDDDETYRTLMKMHLQSSGHTVAEASTGEEGWTKYLSDPVGLIIADWHMPGMSGLDLCRKVRARPSREYTYFVLVSANPDMVPTEQEKYAGAVSAGVDDFISKTEPARAVMHRVKVADRIVELTRRLSELEGVISVCAYCKRVRSDDNAYQQLESYVQNHSRARFSHGVCPDCKPKVMKEALGDSGN